MSEGQARFAHLSRMTDEVGLFEHALHAEPRVEHGYCVDDVARGLVVTAREPDPGAETVRLSHIYLRFVVDAQARDGRFHNRRNVDGRWTDEPTLEDCWGRAMWGLGTAVSRTPDLADTALAAFDRSVRHRTPWTRAMAFAAMGAAEVLTVLPDHRAARSLLRGAALQIGTLRGSGRWTWPEPRLRYANAVLAETMMAAGTCLDERAWVDEGLGMLRWLVRVESPGEHLSVTPVGGWVPGDARPGFDQQPIEVAALADACARALAITGDGDWARTIELCAVWFEGANDAGIPMMDPIDGAGYDGLHADGRNDNRGAESTLAALATMQQLALLPVRQR